MDTSNVTRSETKTAKWGRVVTYRVELDGVTFEAEHGHGDEHYTVSTRVGRCGTSSRFRVATVACGPNVAARFLTLATNLRRHEPREFLDRQHFDPSDHSAAMCCDEEACGRFRPAPRHDPYRANAADRERARVAGVYAYNVGTGRDWTASERMRAIISPEQQGTSRAAILVAIFEGEWQANADYAAQRAAERATA